MTTLGEKLKSALAFSRRMVVDDLEFQKIIINKSLPHEKRKEPAWSYSLEDATNGAQYENQRLTPIQSALVQYFEAGEEYFSTPTHLSDFERGVQRSEKKILLARANLEKVLEGE